MRFDEGSLKELFEPVIESLGFEYWGLELLNHGRNLKIRLYIEAEAGVGIDDCVLVSDCLLYTSPSPRDLSTSRMPSSA